MTSTEIAVIDAEVLEAPVPLSEGQAKVLDKRIRLAGIRVADNQATLLDLLEQASAGQIHVALGFPSWTAWVKDAVSISPTNPDERKALVSMMSGKGVPQRTMGAVLGVNQATISRDVAEGDADASGETIGVDDKAYPKHPKKPKQEPLVVDEVELEEKQQPVSQDFRDEMYQLLNSVSSFQDILKDERFPKARKTIAKNNRPKLQDAISELQAVDDALME